MLTNFITLFFPSFSDDWITLEKFVPDGFRNSIQWTSEINAI
jgi:hypothetical protein